MRNKYYIATGGRGSQYATVDSALKMIDKWLDEGELSGTDHYIGPKYDTHEYLNLILIDSILREIVKGR